MAEKEYVEWTLENIINTLKDMKVLSKDMEFTEDDVYSVGDYLPKGMRYAYGASKFVVIAEPEVESNFVVKIPFNGEYIEEEECNEDEGWVYTETVFHQYEGAEYALNYWDYCETEASIYKMAEEAGLASCFAKTELVDYVSGYPVYKQEKATIFGHICYDEERASRYSEERTDSYKKTCQKIGISPNRVNINWMTDFLEYYGAIMLKRFVDFLNKIHIGDLHTDNIGYIGDRPVLVDYSSFDC